MRWVARPGLARLLRLVLLRVPLGVSTAVVLLLRPLSPPGTTSAGLLGATATAAAMLFERALRRIVSLTTLLRLTMSLRLLRPAGRRAPAHRAVVSPALVVTGAPATTSSTTATFSAAGGLRFLRAGR